LQTPVFVGGVINHATCTTDERSWDVRLGDTVSFGVPAT
jgi:hypothetical protein